MLQSVSPANDLPRKDLNESPASFGLLSPLTIQAFRLIWIANLFANLGTWAQSVAAAWVVTEAHASPVVVAMIQVAAALPLVLLSILSGVLADNHDRRKIMLVSLSFECTGAVFLSALAFIGYLDPFLLIISILWMSIGGAITIPAWQAAVGEQVPQKMLGNAVLLNSVNYNVARAAGPALGGMMLSWVGPAWVFLFNCLCYVSLIAAIWYWKRPIPVRTLPPERLFEGVVAALRFTQHSSVTRLVMLRSFSFGLSASAVWALLPLLAHRNPEGNATVYGYMLGALGAGAIFGSLLVNRGRKLLGTSRLISTAGLIMGLMILSIGLVDNLWFIYLTLIIAGSCWIAGVASYNSSVQLLVPDWVKARALALYQTALYCGLAVGSYLWGHLAESMSVHGAMITAGCLMMICAVLLYPSRLPELESGGNAHVDSPRPGDPAFAFNPTRGNVLVSIEYRIPAERTRDFVRASQPLRRLRLRNGAERWSLYRDTEEPEIWQEILVVQNWLQHLRMLDRMTTADKTIIDSVVQLHDGEAPPRVRHGVSYKSGRYDNPPAITMSTQPGGSGSPTG